MSSNKSSSSSLRSTQQKQQQQQQQKPWMRMLTLTVLLLICSYTKPSPPSFFASAFYVPGVRPTTYARGQEVQLKVNALTSTHTQIPRDYYRLPFCQPPDGPAMASENLGEFLTGNKIQTSPYQINMRTDASCKKLCGMELDRMKAAKLRLHIKYGYHHNWIIDNLPSAALVPSGEEGGVEVTHYAGGFPIGFYHSETNAAYVFNHVNIHISYHPVSTDSESQGRIVAFAVEPLSIHHSFQGGYEWDGFSPEGFQKPLDTCPAGGEKNIQTAQVVKEGEFILYTYDVIWKEDFNIEWSSRWDVYLSENHHVPAQVHWYSITNSILVVMFLSLLVLSILVRNLRRDIDAYNALAALADEEKDDNNMDNETGWKLVHADVFRPPSAYPMLYCVFIGTGSQLGFTAFFAIIFSAVGFLSPARRGSLMTAFLVFFMLTGMVSGFVSSKLYKAFRGRQWQLCTLLTAIFFPGMAYIMFLFFNLILWAQQSSASAPFLEVVILAAMWCCVSIPLVFLGAYFGYKQDTLEFPTVTSTIARAIPPAPPLLHPMLGMVLTGIVPFAAAYVELFFILTSLWMDQFYYVFGFTLVVYLILIVTCAEVTVLLVYYQLCAENHRWWWYAFFTSGSTALYTFLYSIVWFHTLEPSRLVMTYLLYFGYMFLICFGMMLIFGSVGALTSLWFVRRIFATIKVD